MVMKQTMRSKRPTISTKHPPMKHQHQTNGKEEKLENVRKEWSLTWAQHHIFAVKTWTYLKKGKKQSISPMVKHSNNKENTPTIPTTQQERKRCTHSPTSATIIDDCTQTVKERIHNNIPPRKWRGHSTQKGNTHNRHQQSNSAPRVQRRRWQTLDSDSNQEQGGKNQQCMQLTIDQTKHMLPQCIGRIPSWKQLD